MSIFVSVAAYRDPELAPTLCDCIARARYPADLRFGICWQRGDDEAAPDVLADPRLRVLSVPWRDSRGACWARAEIMRLYDGEDFYLQLDSHHRFVPGWDALLLDQAHRSGATKPLLSTYAAAFDPAAEPPPGVPMRMVFDSFAPSSIPLFRPHEIPDWSRLRAPEPARFVSAHCLFTVGTFVAEVPYDSSLYFHGEEITLAVRAFTHGYTLLHPSAHILWHEYTREYRPKHWDDHVPQSGVDIAWHARDAASLERAASFLTAPHLGPFGCGTVRGFDEYEAYVGLSFRHRAAQDATLRGDPPPNPPAPADWATRLRDWRVRIELDRATLPPGALDDPRFWYVGIHDAEHAELHREDAQPDEIRRLLHGDGRIVIERRLRSHRRPATWTVWPHGANGAWLERIDGVAAAESLVG